MYSSSNSNVLKFRANFFQLMERLRPAMLSSGSGMEKFAMLVIGSHANISLSSNVLSQG